MIDETTDIKVQSQLANMVQYWDAILGQLVVKVLEFLIYVIYLKQGHESYSIFNLKPSLKWKMQSNKETQNLIVKMRF